MMRRLSGSLEVRRIVLTVASAAALGLLLWLAWIGMATRSETRLAAQRAVRVAELRGIIAHLDEWLTMSAQMAVVSAEPRWIERYREVEPRLSAAIAEAVALATPEVAAELERTTHEAHRDLLAMQHAAFRLATEGDRPAARALLDGPEFNYLKAVYAAGIDAFGQDLATLATARAAALDDRAWMQMSSLALGGIFFVTAAFSSRGHTRLRAALARTEEVACTDALTGLPNRRRFYEVLAERLARTGANAGSVALVLVDLDRFKPVNDVHGHPAGDRLLQAVATRLRMAAGPQDVVARLGGDEFALIIALADASADAQTEITRLAHRVIGLLERPCEIGDAAKVQISASVGIALSQQPEGQADELVNQADVALYRAKAEGRGRAHLFEPGMDVSARARALLEAELRHAITAGAIVPHYQPLVDLGTGRVVGYEMLARWPHPLHGSISPAEFVPLAEEGGLIGAMTDSLLRRACRAAVHWPAGTMLACNISPLQLRDVGFAAMVRSALDEAGLPAERLELEITESALVGDLDLARELLGELKGLGVRLALDDFGTGYSSLHHLQRLPFDKLKVDRSFVGAMLADEESRKIVAAVIGLGHSLGLTTVAEGVETQEVAALLREFGCHIGQGWLFGRPVPAEAVDRDLAPAPSARMQSPARAVA